MPHVAISPDALERAPRGLLKVPLLPEELVLALLLEKNSG